MTSGAIYPGVPLVSLALLGLQTLAIPRSVTLKYPITLRNIRSVIPDFSKTIFFYLVPRSLDVSQHFNENLKISSILDIF